MNTITFEVKKEAYCAKRDIYICKPEFFQQPLRFQIRALWKLLVAMTKEQIFKNIIYSENLQDISPRNLADVLHSIYERIEALEGKKENDCQMCKKGEVHMYPGFNKYYYMGEGRVKLEGKKNRCEPDNDKYFEITDDGKTKTSELMKRCKDKFLTWSYYSDNELDKKFPPSDKPTTRYFRKVVEADEQHKNKSAEQCEEEGLQGITLRERLIMELQYFEETGKHLDIDNATLCSGSRGVDGDVPSAYWGDDGFGVRCYDSDDRGDRLRPREAIEKALGGGKMVEPEVVDF